MSNIFNTFIGEPERRREVKPAQVPIPARPEPETPAPQPVHVPAQPEKVPA